MEAVPRAATGMRSGGRVRQLALAAFFASVAISAALGIAALLVGEFSETHGRVLATSLSVTGALVVALACLPAHERHRLGGVPMAGAWLGVVAFGLVVGGVWSGTESERYAKVTGTVMTAAVACAIACVLAIPTLAARFRPTLTAALALLLIAAAMVVGGIWIEPESSWYARSLGVVVVLFAAIAVSIPVLHRMERSPSASEAGEASFCPFCGAQHRALPDCQTSCGRCGSRYTISGG